MASPLDTLRRCGFFRTAGDASLQKLAALARPWHLTAGEHAFRQGDACPGIYVVARGAVRIYKIGPAGKEHILHLVTGGMTFAEVAVIGGFDCPANAQAVEESRGVLLPREPFMQLLRNDHALCLQLMTGMAEWVRQLVGLMEDLVLRDAAGRLARYLLDAARAAGTDVVELAMLKKDLASHLNLTSETLSRTLRRLSDAGLVATEGPQGIVLRDRKGLEAVASGNSPLV